MEEWDSVQESPESKLSTYFFTYFLIGLNMKNQN